MEQKEAAVFRMKRNIKDTVFTRLFREKKYSSIRQNSSKSWFPNNPK